MTVSGDAAVTRRHIFHFTHVDNVTDILRSGYLSCDAAARSGLIRVEVGDPAIKASRRLRRIPVGPGGQVGDYVPFYFAPRSPMMFRIACDHRGRVPGRYAGGDRPLVYLVTTVGSVADAGLSWVATDGNAASAATEFFTDLPGVEAAVDWPLMKATRWDNTEGDLDRQRRRMAEFLVHRRLPMPLIRWFGVYSEAHASQLRIHLADDQIAARIIVRPHWYYGYEQEVRT